MSETKDKPCPFCNLPKERILYETDTVMAFHDIYPVSKGHTLIVPKAHIETYFDCSWRTQQRLWVAVEMMQVKLKSELNPSGFNVGINCGRSSGQTVPHCHIHLIPRYDGDMADPSGGVRGVIPDKQKY